MELHHAGLQPTAWSGSVPGCLLCPERSEKCMVSVRAACARKQTETCSPGDEGEKVGADFLSLHGSRDKVLVREQVAGDPAR